MPYDKYFLEVLEELYTRIIDFDRSKEAEETRILTRLIYCMLSESNEEIISYFGCQLQLAFAIGDYERGAPGGTFRTQVVGR